MLVDRLDEEVFFFGGKDYLPLLHSLTGVTPNPKTPFYNSARPPQAPGWMLGPLACQVFSGRCPPYRPGDEEVQLQR